LQIGGNQLPERFKKRYEVENFIAARLLAIKNIDRYTVEKFLTERSFWQVQPENR
jgi:hypothetical protein